MSQFRRRIRIVLDGRAIDLVTSARDFAAAEVGDDDVGAMESVMRLSHAAALRLHVDGVPSDFDAFADLLDEFVDLEKDDAAPAEPVAIDRVDPDPIPAAV